MIKTSIKPGHERKIRIGFDSPGRDPRLTFELRADNPVTTYLVDDMGLEDYSNGQTPSYYAGFNDRRNHQADLTLPNFSRYHLIIINNSPENQAEIEYDLRVR